MKKAFLLILMCTSLSSSLWGKVKMRWLGVASVLIHDEKTFILFDPAWTRPGLAHLLGLRPFRSEEKYLKDTLKKLKLSQIDAIFVSHSHFDHAVDAPMVAKITGGTYYADKNGTRLAQAYKDSSLKLSPLTSPIKLGDFTLHAYPRPHAAIFHLFHFLPGEVPKKTNLNFWDYRTGETWLYYLTHPTGSILLDQGATIEKDLLPPHLKKVDVLIQGIANRKSDEIFIQGHLSSLSPKKFVPIHFDAFYTEFQLSPPLLPGIRMEKLLKKIHASYPKIQIHTPTLGEERSL